MKCRLLYLTKIVFWYATMLTAQGPPILADKPIMLGEGRGTIRLMYVHQAADRLVADYIMPSADYNITNRLSVEGGLMLAKYRGSADIGFKPADAMLSIKYQYFKLDRKGQTIRLAAKGAHTFTILKQHAKIKPTGMANWGTFGGLIVGWETLKFGLVGDFGYVIVRDISPNITANFFQAKTAFGIPMLKHAFPVRQLNGYIELEFVDQINATSSAFYVAPGLQFAYGVWAFEIFYQRALAGSGNQSFYPMTSLGGGIRFVY